VSQYCGLVPSVLQWDGFLSQYYGLVPSVSPAVGQLSLPVLWSHSVSICSSGTPVCPSTVVSFRQSCSGTAFSPSTMVSFRQYLQQWDSCMFQYCVLVRSISLSVGQLSVPVLWSRSVSVSGSGTGFCPSTVVSFCQYLQQWDSCLSQYCGLVLSVSPAVGQLSVPVLWSPSFSISPPMLRPNTIVCQKFKRWKPEGPSNKTVTFGGTLNGEKLVHYCLSALRGLDCTDSLLSCSVALLFLRGRYFLQLLFTRSLSNLHERICCLHSARLIQSTIPLC